MSDILQKLNPAQREAVTSTEGFIRVTATYVGSTILSSLGEGEVADGSEITEGPNKIEDAYRTIIHTRTTVIKDNGDGTRVPGVVDMRDISFGATADATSGIGTITFAKKSI